MTETTPRHAADPQYTDHTKVRSQANGCEYTMMRSKHRQGKTLVNGVTRRPINAHVKGN